jgi:DnaK suppressor protein
MGKIIKNALELLTNERNRLYEELALMSAQHIDDVSGNDLFNKKEAAKAYVEFDKSSARIKNVQERLAEVEYALRKLEKGTYGICEGCGNPIPVDRLQAIPSATYCVDCKSKQSWTGFSKNNIVVV